VDGGGIPLNVTVTAANRHDVTQLVPLVAGIKLVVAGADGEHRLPVRVLGDRAYCSATHHAVLRWLGTEPVVASRGTSHGSGLGRERYVVEQTIAAVHQNRRLKVRYEKRSHIHRAFLTLACIKICLGRLLRP
jgi:IS5 family transposase